MNPQTTNDGKPYGPILYKKLVKEAYYIIKNTSATYSEVLDMTPIERKYILDFLFEEFTKNQEALERSINSRNNGKSR